MKFPPIKVQLIIFLAIQAAFLSFKEHGTLFLAATIMAVVSAACADSLFYFLKNKKFALTSSSIISGLIIGYVISSDQQWWIFILASIIAIGGKYLIRFRNRHIFNPAALGIFLSIILFGAQTQWKGTYLWYVFLPFGLYFSYKIRKLEVLLGFAVFALGLFGIQAIMQKTPLFNIFGYLSYFYIFIMIIEPKTTPIGPKAKFVFGAGIAVLIFVLTWIGVKFDAELFSLLVLNMTAAFLNKIQERHPALRTLA